MAAVEPTPFRIDVPEAKLELLRQHVKLADLSSLQESWLDDQPDPDDFTYGLAPSQINDLLGALRRFDWRPWERKLNGSYRVHLTDVAELGDIDMHYLHVRSDNVNARPLVLLHGWPGSVLEFHRIAPILKPNYHLIIPSLPGYGWSGKPKRAGKGGSPLTLTACASAVDAVVKAAGYSGEYFVQGGDWGSRVAVVLAQLFPKRVKAIHLNFVPLQRPYEGTIEGLQDWELRGIERGEDFLTCGNAYDRFQGSAPYTLAAALHSPVSWLFYVGEKWLRWTAPDSKLDLDEIVALAMVYWLTDSIGSSFWLYYTFRVNSADTDVTARAVVKQPVRIGFGPSEIIWVPKSAVEDRLNLTQMRPLARGGHFAALEQPELLAADMHEHFSSLA